MFRANKQLNCESSVLVYQLGPIMSRLAAYFFTNMSDSFFKVHRLSQANIEEMKSAQQF